MPTPSLNKHRGAQKNPHSRFDDQHLEAGDFSQLTAIVPSTMPTIEQEEVLQERSRPTQFFTDHSVSVLTRNESPDVGFEASVNPYRGCEHGCAYCYARPTHEYLGLSAGLDFETKIFVKHDAPELLRKALNAKNYEPTSVNLSGITDCYQPVERQYQITRECVRVLGEFRNPFTIITKNFLVTRDIDLFKPMAEINAVGIFITITSLDDAIISKLEPRTSRPAFRLKAIEKLANAGIPVGVMVAPVIPGLTDSELPAILKSASDAGAGYAGFVPLRLPYGLGTLFEDWLTQHFPERKEKILNRVREIRGGKLNDPNFNSRMRGTGVFAEQIRALFHLYEKKYGLNQTELELSTAHFRKGNVKGQGELF